MTLEHVSRRSRPRSQALINGGPAAAAGLRFIGYEPRLAQIGHLVAEATRAAKQIKTEVKS